MRGSTTTIVGTFRCPATRLDVLPEATGVVVADGPRVSERLEDGVRLQNLLLDRAQLGRPGLAAQDGEVLHDDLASLGLPRTRLPAHEDRLDGLVRGWERGGEGGRVRYGTPGR